MLKKQLLFALTAFFLISMHAKSQIDTNYFKANVALVDFRVKSIDSRNFVKEILLVDFLGTQDLPDSIGFLDAGFADDGQAYDAVAGDGIYTTSVTYAHDENHPYSIDTLHRSVYDKAIVDVSFAWSPQLEDYLDAYEPPGDAAKWIVELDCDVSWCGCNSPCGGCWLPWAPQAGCVGCPKFKNCHITMSWEW